MAVRRKHIDRVFLRKLKTHREPAPPEAWEGIAAYLDRAGWKQRVSWITRVAAAAAVVMVAGSVWLLVRDSADRSLTMEKPDKAAAVSERARTTGPGEQRKHDIQAAREESGPIITGEQESPPGENAGRPARGEDERVLAAAVQPARGQSTRPAATARQAGSTDRTDMQAEEGIREIGTRYLTSLDMQAFPEKGSGYLRSSIYPEPAHLSREPSPGGIVLIDQYKGDGKEQRDRWAFGTQFSPAYSYRELGGSFTGADAAGASGNYNDLESGMLAYSAGVNLNYRALDRLTLQSGIYYSRIGMNIEHSYLTPYFRSSTAMSESLKFNSISNSSGNIVPGPQSERTIGDYITGWPPGVEPTDYMNDVAFDQLNIQVREAEIEQQFEYLEVPVILKYKMIDRRMDFNILGGMATSFLIGSDAYFIENDKRELMGTTSGIRIVNYSSIVGMGMDYGLSGRLNLNLGPFFKYYLNSINREGGIKSHPYSFGMYTGISYMF